MVHGIAKGFLHNAGVDTKGFDKEVLRQVEQVNIMPKDNALQRIESHEKLCRIMQKQTYERMNQLQTQITRIERILISIYGFCYDRYGWCDCSVDTKIVALIRKSYFFLYPSF
jgi:hypothetical protein